MKDIFIVRHGESESNACTAGLLAGKGHEYVIDCNFNLTDQGRKQAYEAGVKLAPFIVPHRTKLYVSSYKRTRQTADEIQNAIRDEGVTSYIQRIDEPRLVEQDFGDFDFQYMRHWPEISPHSFKINQARYHDPMGRFFARLENGENLMDVYNRVSLFVSTRLEKKMVDTNIIVTHGNTGRILKMFLLEMPIESFKTMELPDNAGIMHLQYSENTDSYIDLGIL